MINFLIIGTQKGGSTWLYETLKLDSRIFLPDKVELKFFSKNFCEDSENFAEYIKNFGAITSKNNYKFIGENSPCYFWSSDESSKYCKQSVSFNRNIPKSVRQMLGEDLKILISLRHPVWRAISAFHHHAKRNKIKPNAKISDYFDKFGIIDMGFYSRHLREWLRYFPIENFCILNFEDEIVMQPALGVKKVYDFLGLDVPERIYRFISDDSNMSIPKSVGNGNILAKIPKSEHLVHVERDDIRRMNKIYSSDILELKNICNVNFDSWDLIDQSLKSFSKSEKISKSSGSKKYPVLISNSSKKSSSERSSVEYPVRIADAILHHNCSVHAFSYLCSGNIYNADIGRYCSIARDVNIGQGNHPMDWISTSPIQYQNLSWGDTSDFIFSDNLSNVDLTEMRRCAVKSVKKPQTVIGNDVWVGHKVIIMPGVKIGDGAIIGAGSVVTKDVPAYAIAAGVPAKVIRNRFDDQTIGKLLELQWWKYAIWDLRDASLNNVDEAIQKISKMISARLILPYHVKKISIRD
jgi:acetyltransferase-like isoleucine patch superfamily enzyme